MPKKNQKAKTQKENTESESVLKDLSQFDINRLAFKYIDDSNKDATQVNCYPKYLYEGEAGTKLLREGKNFIIASGPIKMVKGGIPKLDPKWRPNDQSRLYFWLPYDESQEACVELFNVLKGIDKYLDKEINKNENKKGILAKQVKGKVKPLKNCTYTKAVKMSPTRDDDDDDDDENKNKYKPYERIKVRFSTLYDENLGPNDPKEINTYLFVDGNTKPEAATTPTDFEKHFYWNCTCQFALMLSKIWVQKSGDKKCGLTFKCLQLAVVDKPERKLNIQDQFKESIFASRGAGKSLAADTSKKTAADSDEDDDDDDDESDNESEDNKKADSDEDDDDDDDEDDEDDEEDEDDDEDDDDDEDEDEDDDEDEDEEEEEEVKPAKKVKVTKKTGKSGSGKKAGKGGKKKPKK